VRREREMGGGRGRRVPLKLNEMSQFVRLWRHSLESVYKQRVK